MIDVIIQMNEGEIDPAIISILMFVLLVVVIFVLSMLLLNIRYISQLLKRPVFLAVLISSALPSLIILTLDFAQKRESFSTQASNILPLVVIVIIASSIIAQFLAYKTIDFGKIRSQRPIQKDQSILKVEDLRVYFPIYKGMMRRHIADVKAVDGVSFEIKSGETYGLVGESGCGKTTIARTILGLVKKKSGRIFFEGKPLEKFTQFNRQFIQVIFQDPDASLNPKKKIVDIVGEPFKNMMGITNNNEIRERVLKLLKIVSLKREHMDRFPHEFSGGQKQRIIIARALASNPHLIVLDEPTSALDVSVQAQILNLLEELQDQFGYAYLFITHDLSVVHHIADRISVMYLGKFVEDGKVDQIFNNTSHPYSKALLTARSSIDPKRRRKKIILEGEVPSPINPPNGCHFNPRCTSEFKTPECTNSTPHKIEVEEDHYIWCINPQK